MAKSTAKKEVAKKAQVKKEVKPEKKVAVVKKATKPVEKELPKKKEVAVKKAVKPEPVKKVTEKPAKAKKAEKEKPGKPAKQPKEEIILEDVALDTDTSSSILDLDEPEVKPRRGKGKQPKQKTLTSVTMPVKHVIDEKPVIERSISGRKSYKVEYTIKSSPAILFDFVTTPSGLVLWFADKVDINGDDISFSWKGAGAEDNAVILEWIEEYRVRYRWDWMEEDEFFQFRIYKNEVTRDTILEITDFADEKEIPDQIRLWDSQIKRLTQSIGG
jgi:uncharacterized protein YndB with AHSA1/START domain